MIENLFSLEIANYVLELTNVSKPEDGNRKYRKRLDLAHLAEASRLAKLIKLADLTDNSISIKKGDKDFWKVYREETFLILNTFAEKDPLISDLYLYKLARSIL